MASNNYTQANVVPSSDTFREWVDLTNRITYDMEKVVVTTVANTQGACTSGNAYVNRSHRDTDGSGYDARLASSITVMEISG